MKSRILMTGILFGLIHSESTLSAMTYGAGLSMSCGEYVAAVKAGEFEPFTILGNSWILVTSLATVLLLKSRKRLLNR